eukprot:5845462-Alexandrium_andersonii.AAC.1
MRGLRPLAQQARKRPACRRSKIELRPETHGLQAFGARTARRGLGHGDRPLRRDATRVKAACSSRSGSASVRPAGVRSLMKPESQAVEQPGKHLFWRGMCGLICVH